MENIYKAFYCDFDTESKKIGSTLVGPDNIIGDTYSIKMSDDRFDKKVYLYNKFDNKVGFIDESYNNEIKLALAKDFDITAILSFVAYSDSPDPGHYWGQVAIFTYAKQYRDQISNFVSLIANNIQQGVRPSIDLNHEGVDKILQDSKWVPSGRVKLPSINRGSTILKDHQTLSEKMIEKGRERNKGCYAISIIFIIAVIVCILYFILKFANVI